MKKIHYIAPEIDVMNIGPTQMCVGSVEEISRGTGDITSEGDVGADEGGLFGTLE
ncbi:MAG: hypothetical protein KBT27_13685 [Prevotellaceae bacterium]|nr:hypothetical protein [Candidatus Faecinaster equi]